MPPESPSLDHSVHVWCIDVGAAAALAARALPLLSPDEQQRAARFQFQRLRDSFAVTRGILRLLLARYVGDDPAEIAFTYGEQGKPALLDPNGRLRFNVSHSGTLAAYAFTFDHDLGIDIERVRPVRDLQDIAHRFFCAEEVRDIEQCGSEEQPDAFYRCWVRKEAFLKALGGGLSIPLDSFRVSVLPHEPAALLSIANDAARARTWTLRAFHPQEGYAGAIAFHGPDRELHLNTGLEAARFLP